jgi:menaquinol-cytochrome c reductase iron-sulfur subunit
MPEEEKIKRRNVLSLLTWGIGAFIGAGFGLPAIAYIIGPALQRTQETEWVRLGAATKVELGVPTLFKARLQRKTGWIVSDEEISVYVLTENGREFVAMSNICTHLGCRVRWIQDQDQFFCPCHNGIFSKEGAIVSGPVPRPLDRFEITVEEGQLLMKRG